MEMKLEGYWWIPEIPEEHVFGVLEAIPNKGIFLEITGIFKATDYMTYDLNFHRPLPILHGSCFENGDSITLINLRLINFQKRRLAKQKFKVEFLFNGKCYASSKEIKAKTFAFKLQYLDEWVNRHGFNSPWPDMSPKTSYAVQINYTQPEPITLYKDKEMHAYLYFRANGPNLMADNQKVEQSIFLNIEFTRQRNLSQIGELSQKIRYLFSLMTSIPVGIQTMEFWEYSQSYAKRKNYPNDHVDYLTRDNYLNTSHSDYKSHGMVLDYKTISEKKLDIFTTWFEKYEQLQPLLKLYFETNEKFSNFFPENILLNYLSALEIFHGRIRNSPASAQTKNQKTLNKIINSIKNKNHAAFLAARVSPITRITLENRINDVIRPHRSLIDELTGDSKKFVSRVVATRNDFVHHNPKDKRVIPPNDLLKYLIKLRMILHIVLLCHQRHRRKMGS